MSSLTVNLKQLYQRRGLWLAYPVLGLFLFVSILVPLDVPTAGAGRFIGLIALAFMFGMAAAVLQMEILIKPFAFCLPGHRVTVGQFVFSIGIVTSLLSSLLFLYYPGLGIYRPVVMGSAFCAGLIFYLAGAVLAFRCRQASLFLGLLAAGMLGGRLLGLHILLEQAVVDHPAVVFGLSLLVAIVVWSYLNNVNLARRHCLRPWVGFEEVFNREKLRRSLRDRAGAPWAKLKDHPRPWVEEFFVGRMVQCGRFSATRFAWGGLYSALAIVISQWKHALSLGVLLAVVLGYLGPRTWLVMALLPLVILQTYASQPPVYSMMLTAGGRDERFGSTLAVVVGGAALLAAFVAFVALVSVLLVAVLPDIECYGHTATYRVVGVGAFYAPLFFLPLAATVQLLSYRRPALMTVELLLLAYLMMIPGALGYGDPVSRLGPTMAVAAAAACWLIFVLVLRHISTKRCLVR